MNTIIMETDKDKLAGLLKTAYDLLEKDRDLILYACGWTSEIHNKILAEIATALEIKEENETLND